MNMMRNIKYFLATSCLVSLAVIVYRYSRISYRVYMPSKIKLYSFNLDKNTIRFREDRLRVENVEWTKESNAVPQKYGKEGDMTSTDINTNEAITIDRPTAALPLNKVEMVSTTERISTKVATNIDQATTVELTTRKPTEEKTGIAITLPLLTKAAAITEKMAPPRTTKKLVTTVATVRSGGVEACSKQGEHLVGPLKVDQSVPETESNVEDDWQEKGWVEKGGAWRPAKCQAVSKVAIIIPYRNREQQLKIFLRHMHPMLKRQLLDYRIMVIEQSGETPFNRAMLFNIGYKESLKFRDFQCFVFHDVDLIPENDKNYYGCPTAPRHLSVAIDKFKYRLPYKAIFGGAGAFRKEDFERINGFSNQFWGWGGEDDDLYKRITAKGFKLTRPSMVVGRYKMVRIFHKSAKADPKRFEKLRNSHQRMVSDGLNSLKYKIDKTVEFPLYTKVTVVVDPNET